MKIVVIGGTGLIGSKAVPMLRQGGDEVVAASPTTGVNTITGEGLTAAMAGTQVGVGLAHAPSREGHAGRAVFSSSRRAPRAAAARDAGAACTAEVALAAPRRGIVEIAGPERAPLYEFVARYLQAVGDPRQVVRDPEARYFGGRVEEHSLVPLGDARLGRIGLDQWLRRSQARA